ncbi:MAG: hypothetical protein IJO43_02425 [Bacilli bacterium]|nr:hypothetical protein [Bacilli bacterium]
MEFVKKNIKWIALGGLGVAFLGLFLPYATVTAELFGTPIFSQSITYVKHDGIFVLLAIVACGVLLFLKKELFSLIPLGLGAGITVYSAFNVGKVMGETQVEGVKTSFSIGFYMLIIGLVVAAAAICYSEFVLKKKGIGIGVNNQGYAQPNYNQGYQPYNYNQPTQPIEQPSYNQPFVGGPVNDVQQPMGMPANNDTYNQTSVAQNPVQSFGQVQPAMNNMQQPVQDFSNPAVVNCPQCGTALNAGTQFCHQCGSKVN